LLANESKPNYVWVLQTLLSAVDDKQPECVITDGDRVMIIAIKKVFPSATHRLCSCHLHKNVTSNVKNNPSFKKEWRKFVHADYAEAEFEGKWNMFVEECGLQDNGWVRDLFVNIISGLIRI
ncbi:Protein FAR1-RELATED SEQUENCE 7, partial [Linum perenne]